MTGPWDADLGDALAAGLLGPVPADLAAFEAAFVAHVTAGAADPDRAWDLFYDATLARVGRDWGRQASGGGTVATFTRIWARAAEAALGRTVLDVGTCFGFLPLAWTARAAAPRVLAAELSGPATRLLARQARRLALPVPVLHADGARLPLRDRSVGTVLLLHVLEHVPGPVAARLLAEALRVAEHRVVVAVPVEERPDPVFGHLEVFDADRLARIGAGTGWHTGVEDGDGAWLVLDRPVPPVTCAAGRADRSGRRPRRGA